MAGFFGVSLPTMQAAIHVLISLGLVRTSPGVGTFVTRPKDAAGLVTHAWLNVTPAELAMMRFAIDQQVAVLVARRAARARPSRMPRTLSDISFWAMERSASRTGYPEDFLRADLRFHHEVARSVRRAEITSDLYRQIGERLMGPLMAVADVQAGDESLDEMHRVLAASILDGQPVAALRLARAIARSEMESLNEWLGSG